MVCVCVLLHTCMGDYCMSSGKVKKSKDQVREKERLE